MGQDVMPALKSIETDVGGKIYYGAAAVENGWRPQIGKSVGGVIYWEDVGPLAREYRARMLAENMAHARAWSIARGLRVWA